MADQIPPPPPPPPKQNSPSPENAPPTPPPTPLPTPSPTRQTATQTKSRKSTSSDSSLDSVTTIARPTGTPITPPPSPGAPITPAAAPGGPSLTSIDTTRSSSGTWIAGGSSATNVRPSDSNANFANVWAPPSNLNILPPPPPPKTIGRDVAPNQQPTAGTLSQGQPAQQGQPVPTTVPGQDQPAQGNSVPNLASGQERPAATPEPNQTTIAGMVSPAQGQPFVAPEGTQIAWIAYPGYPPIPVAIGAAPGPPGSGGSVMVATPIGLPGQPASGAPPSPFSQNGPTMTVPQPGTTAFPTAQATGGQRQVEPINPIFTTNGPAGAIAPPAAPQPRAKPSTLTPLFMVQDSGMIDTLALYCIMPKCPLMFASRGEHDEHLKATHGTDRFRCIGCNESYNDIEDLGRHVRHRHKNLANNWSCPECGKKYRTHNKLHKHIYRYHHRGLFKCLHPGCPFGPKTYRDEIYLHYYKEHNTQVRRRDVRAGIVH